MSKKDKRGQRPNYPREAWIFLGFAVFALIIFVLTFILARGADNESQTNGAILSIILGIMSSIIASVIVLIIQRAFASSEHKELTKQLDTIEEALSNQSVLYNSGIRSIHPKIYFDKEGTFWTDILNNTEDKLDLVGHSIRTWFYSEFKDAFFKRVKAMLNDEKEVRIVLAPKSKPWFNCVFDVALGRYEWKAVSKAGKTVRDLYYLLQDVNQEKRKYLKVYVADPAKVTYMYIRTDGQSIVSPYIFSCSNSPHTFLLELESTSAYAKAFERDFEDMIGDLTYLNLGGFRN